jgi:predicted component of type VI protein secretion system
MTDEDARIEASQARIELDLTEKAFATMRESAVKRWAATKDHETQLREGLYRSVQVIDAVQRHLLNVLNSAEVADFAEAVREQLAPGA